MRYCSLDGVGLHHRLEISGTSISKMPVPEAKKGLKKNSAAFPLVFAGEIQGKISSRLVVEDVLR
jgi:hypothetical protein